MLSTLALVAGAAASLDVVAHRPAASTWKRTQCGSPSGSADIPSKYAMEVSSEGTPLVKYPRPQMVRGSGTAESLRDVGDASVWTNLNGLWEWEATTSDTLATPPFGRKLKGSILVPFPVESCLSGVAPNSSAAIVKNMWYRLTFDAKTAPATLLHFGAVDWQSTVFLNGEQIGNNTGGYNGFDCEPEPCSLHIPPHPASSPPLSPPLPSSPPPPPPRDA
jgi:hypothetical protein